MARWRNQPENTDVDCIALFCLSGLYLELGLGYVDPLLPPPAHIIQKLGPGAYYLYDFNNAPNPRGQLSIGHEWNPSNKVRVSMELRHNSWLATTADKGENSAWLSLRLRPWQWDAR
jgi:hypothetical protein